MAALLAWTLGRPRRPELDKEADGMRHPRAPRNEMMMIPRTTLLRHPGRALLLAASLLPLALAGCGKGASPTQPGNLPPLSAVVLFGSDHDTLNIGETLQLVAVGIDSTGDTLRDLALTWRSSDLSVLTVTSSGLVRGVSEGNAKVRVYRVENQLPYDSAFVFVRPSAGGWIVQISNAIEDLNAVYFLSSGRTGWAVGDGGVVLKSSDAGGTWSRQQPTTFDLYSVWFVGSTGYAVGASGTILKSDNLGATWARLVVSQAAGRTLRGVYLTDTSHVFIVGDLGLLLAGTVDGSHRLNWTTIPTSIVTPLNSVSFTGALDGWAAGDNGFVFGTRDGGVSWYRAAQGSAIENLKAVSRRSQPSTPGASGAVVVGRNGVVLRAETTLDSLAWALGNAGSQYDLFGVSLPIGQVVYAAGSNVGQGAILRSDDGGDSWTAQNPQATVQLNAIFFVDALRGWAVGNNGTLRHTATGGLP